MPAPPRQSAVLAPLHPFRLVTASGFSPFKATIAEINSASWDYEKLHTVVGTVPAGLDDYELLICHDGTLAAPAIETYRDHDAARRLFNKVLSSALLGGVPCVAVSAADICEGSFLFQKYVRATGISSSRAMSFNLAARGLLASPYDAIRLLDPNEISVLDFRQAVVVGLSVHNRIPNFDGEFLLRAHSSLIDRDWSAALSNAWVCVEQLTDFVWQQLIVRNRPSDRNALEDSRTFTAAVRHEIFYQIGALESSSFEALTTARRARNRLHHRGDHPTQADAEAAMHALEAVLKASLKDDQIPITIPPVGNQMVRQLYTPYKGEISPKFWMPIPKLPGELELEQNEASR